jgi:GxxExxY protein
MRDPLVTLTERVIGAAITVHRALGPGLMESIYSICLGEEFRISEILFEREVRVPVSYRGIQLDCGYRIDFVIERELIVELKSIARFEPVHTAQLMTYMKLTNCPVGLLLNFNVAVLKDGIRRIRMG